MRFILDENISVHIADFLAKMKQDVTHTASEYGFGARDQDFLPKIADEGWMLITGDRAMSSRTGKHGHRKILEDKKVRVLFLPGCFIKYSAWEKAEWFIRYWKKIQRQASELKTPLGYIDSYGNVTPKL